MKIDTLEKLEILLFGLNAGRELDICLESGTSGALHFGDFAVNGFNLDSKGNLESRAHEIEAVYMVLGCLQHSKDDAAQWFEHIADREDDSLKWGD